MSFKNGIPDSLLNDLDVFRKKFDYLEYRIITQTKENDDIRNSINITQSKSKSLETDFKNKENKIIREKERYNYEYELNEIVIKQIKEKISEPKRKMINGGNTTKRTTDLNLVKRNSTNLKEEYTEGFFDIKKTQEGENLAELHKQILMILDPKVNLRNYKKHQLNEDQYLKLVLEDVKKLEIKVLNLISDLSLYEKANGKVFDSVVNERKEYNQKMNFIASKEAILQSKFLHFFI